MPLSKALFHSPIHTPTTISCHARRLAQERIDIPRVESNRPLSDCQETAHTSWANGAHAIQCDVYALDEIRWCVLYYLLVMVNKQAQKCTVVFISPPPPPPPSLPREDTPTQPLSACRIHGHLYVNKVAGNFHITVGKYVPPLWACSVVTSHYTASLSSWCQYLAVAVDTELTHSSMLNYSLMG